MDMKRIIQKSSSLILRNGFTRVSGVAGYIHVTSEPLRDAGEMGAYANKRGLSDEEAALLNEFNKLSPDNRDALLRFASYAARADECTDKPDDPDVADWLDEQARLFTQE